MERAPSRLRVAWLTIALEGRRRLNQGQLLWKRGTKSGKRTGTARKGAPAKLLLAFVSLVFLFNVTDYVTRIVRGVARDVESRQPGDVVLVSRETLEGIDWLAKRDPRFLPPEFDTRSQRVHMFEVAAEQDEDIRDPVAKRQRAEELLRVFEQRGRAGFRARAVQDDDFFPSVELWIHTADPLAMLGPLGAVGLLLCLGVTLLSAVGSDRDLARTEAVLEWWFTFPVSARGLLLSRVLGTALTTPMLWLFVVPFFGVVFWCAGLGPWLGVLLALPAALYIGLLAGSLRVVAETVLRRLLSLRRVAQVQAALDFVGSVPLLLAMAAALSATSLAYLLEHTRGLPSWALFNPLTLPLCWLLAPRQAWLASALMLGVATLTVNASLSLGSYMLRDGLSLSSGPLLGTRKRVAPDQGGARSLLAVIAHKELVSVTRDPGRLMRVLVFPVAMICFNGLLNPEFFHAIVTNPAHAGATAFGIGSLVLVGGALLALANEGAGLWLLYTAPWSIEHVLLRKALVWSALAAGVTTLALMVLALLAHRGSFLFSPYAALALVGVVLYGFIAVGLGALGTDVLESERQRRMQPLTAQLFFLLTAMFLFALYTPSVWAKFAQLSLSSLFAFAVWQKLRDHAPYLLDPSAAPPPRIAVSDGVFAALAFFVLQGLLGALFRRLHISPGLTLLFAFVGAGLVVTAATLYAFHRMGVPALPTALGFRAPDAKPLRAVLEGLLAGALSGVVAIGFTLLIQQVGWLRELYEETEKLSPSADLLPWLYLLAVFAAPLFEELIFRGVLYRGFRRSLQPLHAALASALVFALVHPPLSFVPVFVMAFLAASVFERSKLLVSPIVTHMTYNAMVVGLSLAAQ